MSDWQDARCESRHYEHVKRTPRYLERRRYHPYNSRGNNYTPTVAPGRRRLPTDIALSTKDRAYETILQTYMEIDNSKDWVYFAQGMIDCLIRYNTHMYEGFQMPYLFDGLVRLVCAYIRKTRKTDQSPVDVLHNALLWALYTSQTGEEPSQSARPVHISRQEPQDQRRDSDDSGPDREPAREPDADAEPEPEMQDS